MSEKNLLHYASSYFMNIRYIFLKERNTFYEAMLVGGKRLSEISVFHTRFFIRILFTRFARLKIAKK